MPNVAEIFKSIAEGDIVIPGFQVLPPDLPDENDIIYQKILLLSYDKGFQNDIEKIRSKNIKKLENTKSFAVLKDKYGLSEKYDFALLQYIRYRSIVSFSLGEEPYVVSKVNEYGIQEFFMKLPGNPSELKKQVVRKNLKRDLEIRQLRQNGNSYKQIAKLINFKYPDKKISYLEVSHLIERLNKA